MVSIKKLYNLNVPVFPQNFSLILMKNPKCPDKSWKKKTTDLIQKDVYCLMNTFYTVDAQHAEVT